MNRRGFLRAAGAAGLGAVVPVPAVDPLFSIDTIDLLFTRNFHLVPPPERTILMVVSPEVWSDLRSHPLFTGATTQWKDIEIKT